MLMICADIDKSGLRFISGKTRSSFAKTRLEGLLQNNLWLALNSTSQNMAQPRALIYLTINRILVML